MGSVVKYHSVWGRVFGSVSADHGCGFAYGVAVVLVGGRNAYEAREEGDVVVHCGIRDRGDACGGVVSGGAAAETGVSGGLAKVCV